MTDNNFSGGNLGNSQPKGKGGKGWKALLLVVLGILLISPVDFIPGDAFTIVGLADDLVYIAGIIGTVASMLKGRNIPSGANVDSDRNKYNDVSNNSKK